MNPLSHNPFADTASAVMVTAPEPSLSPLAWLFVAFAVLCLLEGLWVALMAWRLSRQTRRNRGV